MVPTYEETDLPTEVIVARLDAFLAEQRTHTRQPVRRRGRPCGPATMRKLSRRTFDHYARAALADPACPPLRRARVARGWTLRQLADRPGLSLNTVWAAEQPDRADRVHRNSCVKLSRALGVPSARLCP